MNDLPKSKYDSQGRPIKTSIFSINNQSTNDKNKISNSLKTFIFIVIFIYLSNIYFQNRIIDAILFPIMYLIIIISLVFMANSNIKKFLQDKDQFSNLSKEDEYLFSKENKKDLVDKVDADLLEESDFDANKADKIIEEFNK